MVNAFQSITTSNARMSFLMQMFQNFKSLSHINIEITNNMMIDACEHETKVVSVGWPWRWFDVSVGWLWRWALITS